MDVKGDYTKKNKLKLDLLCQARNFLNMLSIVKFKKMQIAKTQD